ncbi:MAG: cyclic nucleotide-binding domain-containing protein [Hominenteromicrobium sp.]|uniref:cyclic nucleotide-binding domain-containing protein n=1 Tax=Hominenteromicrobium sp. TaxID=3073581 RepID=UPI0039A21574
MRRIRDKKQVEYWLQKGHIRENFDTENLPFSVCRFEKGEYLTRQGGRLAELLFLIEGEVQIYGIREDGSVTPVNRHEAPALLGDAEFVMGGASSLFTEARTTVICAALPMEPYRAELDRDVKFLHLFAALVCGGNFTRWQRWRLPPKRLRSACCSTCGMCVRTGRSAA